MTTASDGLGAQARARQVWLDRSIQILANDDRVVAAWLFGSEGRGDADALSDIDLFVALDDAVAAAELDRLEEWFPTFGSVLWSREVPYNAPDAGRYFSVGYPGPVFPIGVDWYWQPAAAVRLGSDTRVVIDRIGLTPVDPPVETFDLFPAVRERRPYERPADPTVRMQEELVWAWAMVAVASKYAARGWDDRVAPIVQLLRGVAMNADLTIKRELPPLEGEGLDALRAVVNELMAMEPGLVSVGISPPDPEVPMKWLSLAEQLIRERGAGDQ